MSMCVYIYVCVCAFACVYMSVHIFVLMCVYACMLMRTRVSVCVCVCMTAGAPGGQRCQILLELEFQVFVSCLVGARDETQVLWKSSSYSSHQRPLAL